MTFRPRLRTILLSVNVIILMLPVAGVVTLRIYDNELLRQTESSLIAQAAFVQATYKNLLLQRLIQNRQRLDEYGLPVEVAWPTLPDDPKLRPVQPKLDVTVDEILPPAPAPVLPAGAADPWARSAGEAVTPVLEEAQAITLAGLRVVDARGTIVGTTDGEVGESIGHREEVRRALRGEVVSVMRQQGADQTVAPLESISRRTQVRVFVVMPVVHNDRVYGAVVVSRTPMSLMKALYTNRIVLGGLLGLLMISVALITLLTTVTIQRPLRALIRQTERIATLGGPSRAIESPGTREFAQLSEAFAEMAGTLERRSDYIRGFARDVSHEFKTPLASIRGTVELLEDHFDTMPEDKRAEFLHMIQTDCDRLDRLVRRLLELARADVFTPTMEWIDAAEVLPELAERANVSVDLELGDGTLPVAMSLDAFSSVFGNLFDNSAQHGGDRVRVELLQREPERARILVSDDGPGVSESNRERVFDSFFTTARDSGGTGLGLPIVRSLLQRHGGDIELTPSEKGAAFLVTLPLR